VRAYSFRLATVLRVREVGAALAQQRVAQLSTELRRALETERIVTERYEAAIQPQGELDSSPFVAGLEQGERLAGVLASARAASAAQAARLQIARLECAGAERRVAVLERLDERRRRDWVEAVWHEDVTVLDDISTIRAATRLIGVVDDH